MSDERFVGGFGFGCGYDWIWWVIIIFIVICIFCPGLLSGFGGLGCCK